MRVAVLDDYHRVWQDDPSTARLRARVPVDVFEEKVPLERLREYPILVGQRERTKFDAEFFAAMPQLKLLAQTGNHAYHVDLAAADRAGVTVVLGQSQLTDMRAIAASTIELTFALMLAVMRHVPAGDRAIREGAWPQPLGYTLNGKRLGILGLGRIGREVARIAQAFGAEVLAWGPSLTAERAAASGVGFAGELDDLLDQSEIVSVHLALADGTRGLLDEARLRRIGPRGYLVNTARGAIVDEAALARVLAERAIAGAGLDVFVKEPLPADSPLRRLDNVVITPHLGWQADRTYRYMADVTVRLIEAWLDGAPIGVITGRPA